MGSQHQNIIEINGKKYDAVTGRIVSDADIAVPVETTSSARPVQTVRPATGSGVVDGFRRRSASKPGIVHPKAAHAQKSTQKSQTLMRTVVKKPTKLSKHKPLAPKIEKSHLGVAPSRQALAEQVKLSPKVSRFGNLQQRSSVVKKVQPLAVKQPSNHHLAPAEPPKVQAISVPAVVRSQRATATSTLIEKALSNAHSHEQTHRSKPRKQRKMLHKIGVSSRALAISSGVLAAVLLGGFFALQNVPNLSMRVASARAGFDATMPSYKPSGFGYQGPISYSEGQVRISFRSHSDDRAYSVTQRESSWNSDALLANFVVTNNQQYQTYLDRGRTLYIYNGSNATWVDNGVWYQIEGDADLTTDQLVRIAASI